MSLVCSPCRGEVHCIYIQTRLVRGPKISKLEAKLNPPQGQSVRCVRKTLTHQYVRDCDSIFLSLFAVRTSIGGFSPSVSSGIPYADYKDFTWIRALKFAVWAWIGLQKRSCTRTGLSRGPANTACTVSTASSLTPITRDRRDELDA